MMGARSGTVCAKDLEELADGSTTASPEASTVVGDGRTGISEVSVDAEEGRENTDFGKGFSDPTTDEMGT